VIRPLVSNPPSRGEGGLRASLPRLLRASFVNTDNGGLGSSRRPDRVLATPVVRTVNPQRKSSKQYYYDKKRYSKTSLSEPHDQAKQPGLSSYVAGSWAHVMYVLTLLVSRNQETFRGGAPPPPRQSTRIHSHHHSQSYLGSLWVSKWIIGVVPMVDHSGFSTHCRSKPNHVPAIIIKQQDRPCSLPGAPVAALLTVDPRSGGGQSATRAWTMTKQVMWLLRANVSRVGMRKICQNVACSMETWRPPWQGSTRPGAQRPDPNVLGCDFKDSHYPAGLGADSGLHGVMLFGRRKWGRRWPTPGLLKPFLVRCVLPAR
jgi:hypothetical protein